MAHHTDLQHTNTSPGVIHAIVDLVIADADDTLKPPCPMAALVTHASGDGPTLQAADPPGAQTYMEMTRAWE